MTNVPKNDGVGDRISPARRQPAAFMQSAASAGAPIAVDPLPKPKILDKAASLATSLGSGRSSGSVASCVQTVWFSFFFDGTGNNLNADAETLKHSNVAKLYRAHKGDENIGGVEGGIKKSNSGIYRAYIPGIGTYFPAIKDNGGSAAGLGAGAFGEERITWAFELFDKKMASHIALDKNPGNAITEINISVFGFSRGAALARAFIYDFVEKRCKEGADKKWRLKSGGYPIRIRFMGLFDTVASVGFAMSANNMEKIDALRGTTRTHIQTRLEVHHKTRPTVLAFAAKAQPGADPSPGNYNGHASWGDRMRIPEMVEEVRHFVAGHEIRNSFPVDSISVIDKNRSIKKPPKFHEYVYPGVHSDVGGSYRPGEGGKNEIFNTKLGLVPLRDMYLFALACGIPFMPESAWSKQVAEDFEIDSKVIGDYKYYHSKLVISPLTLGGSFNAHMKLFYAWRFHSIGKKRRGDRTESERIAASNVQFNKEYKVLSSEIAKLKSKQLNAETHRIILEMSRDDFVASNESSVQPNGSKQLADYEEQIRLAKLEEIQAALPLRATEAKMLALPKTSELANIIKFYDEQLMLDAQAIFDVLANPRLATSQRGFVTNRSALRPHYKILVEAYENEFLLTKGLEDGKIIAFFENYVHDSLSGFGQDGTLPSDPRVIYLGDDEKLDYALLEEVDKDPSAEFYA